MPFVSEAQRRWMYANHPEMAKRWEKHTPKGKKLPERVGNKEKKSGLRKIAQNTVQPTLNEPSLRPSSVIVAPQLLWYEMTGQKFGAAMGDAAAQLRIIKQARSMPSFTEQDRPAKVKEIYLALKREHPEMPAEMKARIAARHGKPGKQKQGPPYKDPLT